MGNKVKIATSFVKNIELKKLSKTIARIKSRRLRLFYTIFCPNARKRPASSNPLITNINPNSDKITLKSINDQRKVPKKHALSDSSREIENNRSVRKNANIRFPIVHHLSSQEFYHSYALGTINNAFSIELKDIQAIFIVDKRLINWEISM